MKRPSAGADILTPAVVVAEYVTEYRVRADYLWFHGNEETQVPEIPA